MIPTRLARLLIAVAALFAIGGAAGPARAAAVVIWPIDPVIGPQDSSTILWLENRGTTPVTLQVRTFGWRQPDGDEVLDRQDAVVASPPIATVAPGARQLVRVIRRTRAPVAEAAYRLLIDELPPPPAEGGPDTAVAAGLRVQMRYSIPLFAHTAPPGTPRLVARIVQTATGRSVMIHNDGIGHARLTDLIAVARDGHERVVRAGLAGYVLPGATLAIPLPGDAGGTLRAHVNGVIQTLGDAA